MVAVWFGACVARCVCGSVGVWLGGLVAVWLGGCVARRFSESEGSWVRILVAPLRNFGDSVYPTLPVSFGGDTKTVSPFYLMHVPGK